MDHASLKRITLTLARSKDFPNGSDQIGYDLIAPSTVMVISTWWHGKNIAPNAPSVIFSPEKTTRPACWFTRRVAPNMAAGYSIMIRRDSMMTSQASCSVIMSLCPENMFQ